VQELAEARAHFYLPRRAVTPFGGISRVSYAYDLLAASAVDAVGNTLTVTNDFRVLQPAQITDANGNRGAVAFDALGLVVGTAVMGKTSESLGDSLAGFIADLDDATVQAQLADPLANPGAVLGSATTRLIYDLFAYDRTRNVPQPSPGAVCMLARETHVSDLAGGQTRYQHALSYSDGFGREIQRKVLAEPGPVVSGGPVVTPRWIATGWTIFNNKGKPVRTYEPFFTTTPKFEFANMVGVSTVMLYDSADRVVATVHPNQTWTKVLFDVWRQESWDVNDTVLIADPRTDADVGDRFTLLLSAAPGAWASWHRQRIGGALGAAEQAAAKNTEPHAATPAVVHFDSLGWTCLAIADNGKDGRYHTRTASDAGNQPLAIFDPLGRRVFEYCLREPAGGGFQYVAGRDLAGRPLYHCGMDGGERRVLSDVTGKPIRTWDARGRAFQLRYDLLRRPTHRYVTVNATTILLERSVYGEGRASQNLCGQLFRQYDQAGLTSHDAFDYKGNLVASTRQLAAEYRTAVDWTALANLADPAALDAAAKPKLIDADRFSATSTYDALNRVIQTVTPHNATMKPNVIRPAYNQANLLDRIDVWQQQPTAPAGLLDPATAMLRAVTGIEYDAHGKRTAITSGNATVTTYGYDPLTFRLTRLVTMRPGTFPANARAVQDLTYTYDPAGNVTHIQDDADIQNVVYFRNQRVEPSSDYVYDAIYRLATATGREHLGQTNAQLNPPQQVAEDDGFRTSQLQPGDGNAMSTYTEKYQYDPVGNLLVLAHAVSGGSWTRRYAYREPSQITAAETNNRLTSTSSPGDPAAGPYSATYTHDTHGNMTRMPHLPVMAWDEFDHLRSTTRQVATSATPETIFYTYDAGGARERKVTDRQASFDQTGTRTKERIYLGDLELYRQYEADGVTVKLARETLHLSDGPNRVVLIETRTQGSDAGLPVIVRYQHGNHLGSAMLELDDAANVITYEEYFPYGSTSYQSVRSQTETPKRYRFTGKERDQETGLSYHDARYYAPWLARWTSCDPAGLTDGTSLYAYVRGNPIGLADPSGSAGTKPKPSARPKPSSPTAEWDVPRHRIFRWRGSPAPPETSREHGTTAADRAKAQYYGNKYGPKNPEGKPYNWTAGHEKPASRTPPGERPFLRVEEEYENKAGGTPIRKENKLRRLDPSHRDPESENYTRPTKPRASTGTAKEPSPTAAQAGAPASAESAEPPYTPAEPSPTAPQTGAPASAVPPEPTVSPKAVASPTTSTGPGPVPPEPTVSPKAVASPTTSTSPGPEPVLSPGASRFVTGASTALNMILLPLQVLSIARMFQNPDEYIFGPARYQFYKDLYNQNYKAARDRGLSHEEAAKYAAENWNRL
jgi:RHS repeat-associated protein